MDDTPFTGLTGAFNRVGMKAEQGAPEHPVVRVGRKVHTDRPKVWVGVSGADGIEALRKWTDHLHLLVSWAILAFAMARVPLANTDAVRSPELSGRLLISPHGLFVEVVKKQVDDSVGKTDEHRADRPPKRLPHGLKRRQSSV